MADKKGFDLANLLKDVPKLDTADGREQIEYIDIGQIESDPGHRSTWTYGTRHHRTPPL